MSDNLAELELVSEGVVSPELLARMCEAIEDLQGEDLSSYWGNLDADNSTRMNEWPGKSIDGRKWQKNLSNDKVGPFDGAPDVSVWLVDFLIKVQVALVVESVSRSKAAVMPVQAEDAEFAGRCKKALDWMNGNLWGPRGRRQKKLLANYVFQNGKGLLHGYYDQLMTVRYEPATVGTVVDDLLAAGFGDPGDGGRGSGDGGAGEEDMLAELEARRSAMVAAFDGDDDEGALGMLGARFPDADEEELKEVLKDLRNMGVARVPVSMIGKEGPVPTALRVGSDVFFDPTVDDIQEAPFVFLVDRMTYGRGMQRAEREGWDEAFVEAVFGNPAEEEYGLRGMYEVFPDDESESRVLNDEQDDNKYEIVTCLRKAVDRRGRLGVYRVVFCPAYKEGAATEDELLEDAYGQYPLVFFANEVISAQIMDSRGLAEMHGPAQNLMKWLTDLAIAVSALKTLPPIVAPKMRRESELLIAPLAVLREMRPNEIRPFGGFEYPREALEISKMLEQNAMMLTGLPVEGVNQMVTELLQQGAVQDFLEGIGEFYHISLVQLMHNMSPEKLRAIVGGDVMDLTPEELANRVNIMVSFDPRHLDKDFVKGWMETMTNLILPYDSGAMIMRDKLMEIMLKAWDPTFADELLREEGEASEAEIQAERQEITNILAGFPPKLYEFDDGVNFEARMGVLQEWYQTPGNREKMEADPQLFERIQMHYENLQQQIIQRQNQETGRKGVAPGGAGDGGQETGGGGR